MKRRRRICVRGRDLGVAILLLLIAAWPAAPISAAEVPGFQSGDLVTLIVPYGVGGGYDRVARLLQPYLQDALNKRLAPARVTVLVRNMAGAGGRVAYEALYKMPPDGKNVVVMGTESPTQQLIYGARFDVNKLSYLAQVNRDEWAIVVRNDAQAADLKTLIARSQKTPILFGSSGVGSGDHIATLMIHEILKLAGVDYRVQFVHFKSSPEVFASMQRGEAEAYIGSVASILPAIQANVGRMVVVFGKQRNTKAPTVSTVIEQGIPAGEELSELINIARLLVAPPELPAAVSGLLEAALKEAITNPEFEARAEKAEVPVEYADPRGAHAAIAKKFVWVQKHMELLRAALKQ